MREIEVSSKGVSENDTLAAVSQNCPMPLLVSLSVIILNSDFEIVFDYYSLSSLIMSEYLAESSQFSTVSLIE